MCISLDSLNDNYERVQAKENKVSYLEKKFLEEQAKEIYNMGYPTESENRPVDPQTPDAMVKKLMDIDERLGHTRAQQSDLGQIIVDLFNSKRALIEDIRSYLNRVDEDNQPTKGNF